MGCVGPWVRGLSGSRFYVGYMGCVGRHFTWVLIFKWVAWLKFFARVALVQNFCVGQIFHFFAWASFYLLDKIILPCYN